MAKRGAAVEETAEETAVTADESEITLSETVTKVYIGPSIAFSRLRESMILTGTEEEIADFLCELTESYPEIPHLLIAPEALAAALDRVGRSGTLLHKYYEDVLAKSRASRKG